MTLKHIFFSGRFGGEKEVVARELYAALRKLGVNAHIVDAGPGQSFGPKTIYGLCHMELMICICYDDYGEKTDSASCTFWELKHADDHHIPIYYLKMCDKWRPKPPKDFDGGSEGPDQINFVIKKTDVYHDWYGREWNAIVCAEEVKRALHKIFREKRLDERILNMNPNDLSTLSNSRQVQALTQPTPEPVVDIAKGGTRYCAGVCFLLPQPSNVPLNTHFKLRKDLNGIKGHIEKSMPDLSQKQVIIKSGEFHCHQSPDEANCHQSQDEARICIVSTIGVEEDFNIPDNEYLEVIVKMKPEIVVICMSHGAEKSANKLRKLGVRNIFWMRYEVQDVELSEIFRSSWLPFCTDLLVHNKQMKVACNELKGCVEDLLRNNGIKPISIDGAWCTPMITEEDMQERIGKGNLVGNQTGVKLELEMIKDLENAKLYDFDHHKISAVADYSSNISSVNGFVDKLGSTLKSDEPQLIHVTLNKSGRKERKTIINLAIQLCIGAAEDPNGYLYLDGIYRVSSQDAKNNLLSKVKEDHGSRYVILLEGLDTLFPIMEEGCENFCNWIEEIEDGDIGNITFLAVSTKDHNTTCTLLSELDITVHPYNVDDWKKVKATVENWAFKRRGRLQPFITLHPLGTKKSCCLLDGLNCEQRSELKRSVANQMKSKLKYVDIYADDDNTTRINVQIRSSLWAISIQT